MAGGKVATKSRWTIDVWPRNRVRSRLKADRPPASGSTPRQSGSRWLSRGDTEWRTESMKRPRGRGWEIPHSEEGKEKRGRALWKVFHVDKRVGGKLVEKCVPRSENMRRIVKQIRVLNFGESSAGVVPSVDWQTELNRYLQMFRFDEKFETGIVLEIFISSMICFERQIYIFNIVNRYEINITLKIC